MAAKSADMLRRIFDRTSGKCHICHKSLVFEAYGKTRHEGAWEIDHSRPKAHGGKDHLNNLFPACPECNRAKQTKSAREARKAKGKRRPPLNRRKRRQVVLENAAAKGIIGAVLGSVLPLGPIGGAILGALKGLSEDPDK
jgi:5-methylcytosine-specific restriction endonuclease McrA